MRSFAHLKVFSTRMHYSRMRAGRSLTVWRGGGGCFPCQGWISLPGGSSWRGGSPCQRGGSPCQGGLRWGVLPARGSLPGGGFSLPGGSPWWGAFPCQGGLPGGGGFLPAGGFSLLETPPVNRMTNRCKNITLATTSLRPVIIVLNRDVKCVKLINAKYGIL